MGGTAPARIREKAFVLGSVMHVLPIALATAVSCLGR